MRITKSQIAWVLIVLALFLLMPRAHGQSMWRNFFTTNRDPVVEVVAGSNATVQASTVGVNKRRFTVNGTGGGSSITNGASLTNVTIYANEYVTNWTTTDANGWVNTNKSAANQSVRISKGTVTAQGSVLSGATSYLAQNGRNRWYSSDDGQMQWTKDDGTTVLMANTNGTLTVDGIVAGSGRTTNLTHYGSVGATNWTVTSASGWMNTNSSAANQAVLISKGNVTAQGIITGNGSGLSNHLSSASFTDFVLSGTNVVISPTNGNLQSWIITNASWAAIDAANTNFTETVRLNIYNSNVVTWTTGNLSNSVALGPTNGVSVMLFDHVRNTNLWWGYRLR